MVVKLTTGDFSSQLEAFLQHEIENTSHLYHIANFYHKKCYACMAAAWAAKLVPHRS